MSLQGSSSTQSSEVFMPGRQCNPSLLHFGLIQSIQVHLIQLIEISTIQFVHSASFHRLGKLSQNRALLYQVVVLGRDEVANSGTIWAITCHGSGLRLSHSESAVLRGEGFLLCGKVHVVIFGIRVSGSSMCHTTYKVSARSTLV